MAGVVTFTITGQVDDQADVSNQATITAPSDVNDPNLDNNTADTASTVEFSIMLPLVIK